jgi:predicted ester cyclase
MSEANIALAKSWFEEVWNKSRREAIDEMLAPEALLHEGESSMKGPDGFKPFFDRMQSSFSGIRVTIKDAIAHGDKVCLRWSCAMTHTGAGFGIPPTGKRLAVTGMSIVRVEGGRLVEGWQNWDMMGLMQQIQEAPMAPTYMAASV